MTEKRKLLLSLPIPLFFIVVIWCVKLVEYANNTSFYFLGVYPHSFKGIIGILTAPLVHDDIKHLVNNSVPFLLFSVATFFFYRPLGLRVLFWVWLMSGLWVWFGARPAYHIGASGLVYGLGAFLFFSGAIRRNAHLAAVSLIVVFLYGSMIWGIFPFVPDISWEAHLSGGIAGLILAIVYRKDGPQPKKYEWEDEENVDSSDVLIDKLEENNSTPEKN
ncbi:MAG TPA: rhomboid family intramembrane serine protease [Bacteroidales bacterium]|nr:rhomboid family intramembrane serine protease [Bacteroidales bacterium]